MPARKGGFFTTAGQRSNNVAAPRMGGAAPAVQSGRPRSAARDNVSIVPMGFHIYPDVRLLFIRASGVVTQEERVRTLMAWLRDPRYECCIDSLFDVTQAQSTPKLAELRELIAILKQDMPATGPRKLAIVTSKPITFAVARAFESLIHLDAVPLHIRVFMNREQAWTWLRPGEPFVAPR
jgi:hypothetical protein